MDWWMGRSRDGWMGGLKQGPGRSIEGLYLIEVKNNLIDWQTMGI